MQISVVKDQKFRDLIRQNLHNYNRKNCSWILNNSKETPSQINYHNIAIYDENKLVGGSSGYIAWQWYFLDEFWIDEKYRKRGIGTKIINVIEQFAKENNLLGVRVETWDFQSKGFYEKMGYNVYASFKDCPPGTIEYFLSKSLK